MTDEALMAAYCAGDADAFEQLYARLGRRLHGFFMRSFNDQAVADDLLQTTLLKIHRARASFRAGLALRPWVFAIAARVRLDEYRQRRRLPEPLDEDTVASTSAPAAGASDRTDEVRAALAALPETQRIIIHLHRVEGMTFGEIAAALGTTEGAVKLRAFRAYQRLRSRLRPVAPAASRGAL